jgi:DNA-binding protein YbaB
MTAFAHLMEKKFTQAGISRAEMMRNQTSLSKRKLIMSAINSAIKINHDTECTISSIVLHPSYLDA